jgi:hypothetical protein
MKILVLCYLLINNVFPALSMEKPDEEKLDLTQREPHSQTPPPSDEAPLPALFQGTEETSSCQEPLVSDEIPPLPRVSNVLHAGTLIRISCPANLKAKALSFPCTHSQLSAAFETLERKVKPGKTKTLIINKKGGFSVKKLTKNNKLEIDPNAIEQFKKVIEDDSLHYLSAETKISIYCPKLSEKARIECKLSPDSPQQKSFGVAGALLCSHVQPGERRIWIVTETGDLKLMTGSSYHFKTIDGGGVFIKLSSIL